MSRLPAALAVAALASLSSGCAHIYPCQEHGGPAWRELLSEHFAVRTSPDEASARVLIADLETLRAAQRLVLRSVERTDRLIVYALRGAPELAEFVVWERAHLGGRDYSATTHFDERFVVIDGTIPAFQQLALQRRLASEVVFQYLLRAPSWVSLGLVSYLEAVEVRPDEDVAVIGGPLARYTGRLVSVGPEPVEWQLRADERPQHYIDQGTSWLLVHKLLDDRLEGLSEYLMRLSRGEEDAPSFAAAFPGLTAAVLDEALLAFKREPKLRMQKVALPVYQGAIAVLPFSDARLHSARSDLLSHADGSTYTWRHEVEEAERLDPGDPVALAYAYGYSTKERAAKLRAATTLHPDDARVWLASWAFDAQVLDGKWTLGVRPPRETLLDHALKAGLDAVPDEERLQKAQRAAPDHPLSNLAWGSALLRQKRPADALPFIERARDLRPGDWFALAIHAQALADLGRCPQALAEHETILSLAQLEWPEIYLEPLRDRAAALRKDCGH